MIGTSGLFDYTKVLGENICMSLTANSSIPWPSCTRSCRASSRLGGGAHLSSGCGYLGVCHDSGHFRESKFLICGVPLRSVLHPLGALLASQ